MKSRLALLVCVGAGATAQPTATQPGTLGEAGKRVGLLMGSQFRHDLIDPNSASYDAEYTNRHSSEYAASVVGNACKWAATEGTRGSITLDDCVQGFGHALMSGQQFRGHNLCWGNNNPDWLNAITSATDLQAALEAHIKAVMQGVRAAAGGRSPLAWDVVNEALKNNNRAEKPEDLFKNATPWYPTLPNYVDIAFRAARAADNQTLLFYNEYGAEEMGSEKGDSLYMLAKWMVDRGVPIDGIGLQSHARLQAPDEAKIRGQIERLGWLGLDVHITELDVRCPDPCTAEDRKKQAEVYGIYLRACLANPGVCTVFMTWGFTDKYTWLTGPGPRCSTNTCHPLPLNETFEGKPAYDLLLTTLNKKYDGEMA